MLSYCVGMLGAIAFADENNFIPVIDMKYRKNSYLYDDELGRINAWEYYFEQPGGISVDEALSSKKYITGRNPGIFDYPRCAQNPQSFYNRHGEFDYWRKLCKKYIKLNPVVLEKLDELTEQMAGKKVLGVSIRGTDYVSLKPGGHAIQPTPEQVIAKAKEVMREQNFDSVYLATEDKNIVAQFQAAFDDELILPECEYIDFDYNSNKYVTTYFSSRKNDKYLRGLEYVVSKLFLLRCSGLITTVASGTTALMCFPEAEDLKYLYVFDLGMYPLD